MSDTEHPIEWWQNQVAQFQAELDQLNPKLNVAESRITSLEAMNKLLTREKADAEAAAAKAVSDAQAASDSQLAAHAAETANAESLATQQAATIEQMNAQLVNQQGVHALQGETLRRLQTENDSLRAAIQQKNDALAPCMRNVADQLAALQAAVQAGTTG